MGVANWVTAIRESFLHENLIFKQFAKVFTRERNPLYGISAIPVRIYLSTHSTTFVTEKVIEMEIGIYITATITSGKKFSAKNKKDLVMACHIRNYSTPRKS